IYVVGKANNDFGGSELQKMLEGRIFGKAPEIDLAVEQKRQQAILQAIKRKTVQSAHDISEGGLAVALSECLFGTGLGADIKIEGEAVCELFSETQSRYVLSVKPEHRSLFETIVTDAVCVGRVVDEP
ncbi:phosphoribosylformylglycinamidine synthase II, partial [Geobacillus sp. NFOSA3]|nr:phosphoribosylformylglycinamidine synthase II [Geobacillus sp. NFOSA3]